MPAEGAVLHGATQPFLVALDKHTLEEVLRQRGATIAPAGHPPQG